jgi:Uma2 family endonuclease
MTSTSTKPITLEEFLQLPETKPASEYIEGAIIQKPMPKAKHSRLQAKLVDAINRVAEVAQIAYAFPELCCTFGGRSLHFDLSTPTGYRILGRGCFITCIEWD